MMGALVTVIRGRNEMEGFWTVQFQGVQGMGAGVVTLIGGQLFGGDSGMLYTGTYTAQGNKFQAKVQVNRYANTTGIVSVMGMDRFSLDLNGTIEGGRGALSGTATGTSLRFSASLAKQGDLPK